MQVTRYQRQVKTNAVSAPKLSLPEDTFGQSIAKGLGDVGDALGELKVQADTTAYTERVTGDEKIVQNLIYGENGLKSQQGSNARGLTTRFDEAYQKIVDKGLDSLANESQRRMYREHMDRYGKSVRASLINHEFNQLKAHQNAVDLGRGNQLLESAVYSCYDSSIFSDNQQQFDAWLSNRAQTLGLDGDARADFIKKNRSALSVAVVQKMLTDNPDNPWVAQAFFKEAAKQGRIDANGYEQVKKVLKPAIDNATASQMVQTMSDEIIKGHVDNDPNQYGKPITGFSSKVSEVLKSDKIPERLKTKVIQGLMTNEKAINASRAEAYAQNYNNVLRQVQGGVPVANADGYEMLRPEDRNKLSWRAAGHSDVTAWSRLKTAQMNGSLTVAMVNEEIGNLSESDYRSLYQAASGASGVGSDSASDKFINNNLQLALSRVGVKSFKSGYKSSEEYANYRYYVTENVNEWRKQNPNKQLTMDEFSRIVYQTHRTIAADDGVLWDTRYNYAEIRKENDERRAQNLPPVDGAIDDLILYGSDGDALDDSKKVVKRIQDLFPNATLYPDDVVRYWVRLQQNPKAYNEFMKNQK